MRLDPENIPPSGGLMVHAVKSHVPICHLPQAMEFSSDWKRGEVSIEAISGTTKLTLARMSAIAILRRWLPVIWGKSSLQNQELQPNAIFKSSIERDCSPKKGPLGSTIKVGTHEFDKSAYQTG